MPDRSRFATLVMPHLDAGYNLARWLTRDSQDAQDVVQDACVRALKYLPSLEGTSGRAWFLAIVRRATYDWIGRNRPAAMIGDGEAALDGAVDPAAADPERLAIARSELRALDAVLLAMPLAYREVLILRELEDLSYRDIARIVDIPVGTVMSRLARARSLLQRSPLLRAVESGPSAPARGQR